MSHVDYFKDDYHKTRHSELIHDEELQLAWSECAKRFYFSGASRGSEIFEFGGALGYNMIALARDNSCHMLELSEIGRKNAEKFGIKTYARFEEVVGIKFDAVLCRHVLEHVDNPLEILKDLRLLLKPAAKLILVLPVERADSQPVDNEIDFHLFTWNPRTIVNLLRRAGYSEITFHYQSFNARRKTLPIYRAFGADIYKSAVQLAGVLTKSKELVIECR